MVPQPVQALILCFPVTQVTDAVAKSGVSACFVALASVQFYAPANFELCCLQRMRQLRLHQRALSASQRTL